MSSPATSAGLMVYRFNDQQQLEVLLIHPGGPFFRNKQEGWWSIPKGLSKTGEKLTSTAKREFEEEVGWKIRGILLPLGHITQSAGKTVHCWAIRDEIPDHFEWKSKTFAMEWPPKSGKQQHFPEADQIQFFAASEAKRKIIHAQIPFIERLEVLLKSISKKN